MESAISPYFLKKDGTSPGTRVLIDLTESDLEDFAMSPTLDEDEEDDTSPEVQQTAPSIPMPSFMMLNRDVRWMIYKLLLKSETPTVQPDFKVLMTGNLKNGIVTTTWSTSEKTGISAAICRTSRMIAAESLPALYGINIIQFRSSSEAIGYFAHFIGSNRLLINRVRIHCDVYHHHTGPNGSEKCPGEDEIINDVYTLGILNPVDDQLYRSLPNLKHLSMSYEIRRKDSCPAFIGVLTALDSDVVVSILKSKIHSLVTLEMEHFPAETVDYILKFLQSGQKYEPPPADPKVERPPLAPVKPTRPLPPHACLSCQNCKCAHGVKPDQLLEIQESLKSIQSQLAGGATKLNEAERKVLERFAGVFL